MPAREKMCRLDRRNCGSVELFIREDYDIDEVRSSIDDLGDYAKGTSALIEKYIGPEFLLQRMEKGSASGRDSIRYSPSLAVDIDLVERGKWIDVQLNDPDGWYNLGFPPSARPDLDIRTYHCLWRFWIGSRLEYVPESRMLEYRSGAAEYVRSLQSDLSQSADGSHPRGILLIWADIPFVRKEQRPHKRLHTDDPAGLRGVAARSNKEAQDELIDLFYSERRYKALTWSPYLT
jgi:hypothetical protein